MVFQQQLGTLLDKTHRVMNLAGLADRMGAAPAPAERAALLSKTDLLTEMVLSSPTCRVSPATTTPPARWRSAEVAAAIAQQYWPKFAGDRLPENPTACALAWPTG